MAFLNNATKQVGRLNIESGFFLDEIVEDGEVKSTEDALNVGK